MTTTAPVFPQHPSDPDDKDLNILLGDLEVFHFWLAAERVRRRYAALYPDVDAVWFERGQESSSWNVANASSGDETVLGDVRTVREDPLSMPYLDAMAPYLTRYSDYEEAFILDLHTLRLLNGEGAVLSTPWSAGANG